MSDPNDDETMFAADEGSPHGGLVADSSGNLFGVVYDDYTGADEIAEFAKDDAAPTGYDPTPIPLSILAINYYGYTPVVGPLALNSAGDLFAVAVNGGAQGKGEVLEIVKDDQTGDYASRPITIASFSSGDGITADGGLIVDASGDLIGTGSRRARSGARSVIVMAVLSGTRDWRIRRNRREQRDAAVALSGRAVAAKSVLDSRGIFYLLVNHSTSSSCFDAMNSMFMLAGNSCKPREYGEP